MNEPDQPKPEDRRRILFICTANICRSPTAELIARRRFGENEMIFRSAGFLIPDQPCPDNMITALGERHLDASDHRSYNLDQVSIEAADLLLTMEGSHVQKATMLAPQHFAKIVPLKKAASVLEQRGQGSVSIEEFLDHLNKDRDPRQYLDRRWDVADPFGGKLRDYRRAADEIELLVATVIGSLH